MNDEVYALFQEDQGDRQDAPSHWHDKEWLQRLGERDRVRRQRLEELRAAGALQTGSDYFHAALILQHTGWDESNALEAYWQAHEWSMKSVSVDSLGPMARARV